ncbi:MAG: hypothetical protein GF368_03555 [Candidatus Aenigmarchaeota archaeon]|nr:hypothetical protein [Candidatus Aenigmarchaeota archaeon]
MRKFLLTLTLLTLTVGIANSTPDLSVVVEPDNNLWVGEELNISLTCLDNNPNATIESAYLNVTGPGDFFVYYDMEENSYGSYSKYIDDFNQVGEYDVNIYCENNLTEISNEEINVKVSEFTVDIVEMNPDPAYIGDELELGIATKIDGEPHHYQGINFTVKIGNIEESFDTSVPYRNGMWEINIEPPESIGTHDVSVQADYDRTTAYSEGEIEVKSPLQFELVDIDKTWIKEDDNITLTFRNSFKGEPFYLTKNNLNVRIDGYNCEILETSRGGSYSYVKVDTPDLSSGTYDLRIELNYNNEWIGKASDKISYVVPVIGEIVNPKDKAISTTITFEKGDLKNSIGTDGKGAYSSEIPRGTYDIELDFPRSNLLLEDVEIKSFEDPIRYDEITSGFELEGIGVNAIFVYEVALDYDEAHLEMTYDDSLVSNEERITVYRCQKWNFGARVCNGDWKEVTADIDTIRNEVSIDTITLSAFLIGYKKEMIIDANIEKDNYFLEDIVKVLGIVEDENQRAIEGVKVNGEIRGTEITFTAETDSGGVFTKEFQGPSTEGKHDLILTAEKAPYDDVDQTLELEMIRSKKLTLTVPNSLELRAGDSANTEFLLNNIGQTDFYDLTITLNGISTDFYILGFTDIDKIEAGEEKRVPISFNLSNSVVEGSYPGTVRVRGEDVDLEESFTLKVQSKETTEVEESKSKFPSANIVIPNFSWETLAVSVFGVFSIGGAIWFKKKKQKPGREREDVKNILLNIKSEVEKNKKPVKVKKKNKKDKSDDSVYYAS